MPVLSGTRVAVVPAPDDAVVLTPPAPDEPLLDVGAAVRDALRFPLAGPPLAALARRGGTATIVLEPPALPIPGAAHDPRREAIAAAVEELELAGVPVGRQTLLVAGGLARRPGGRDLETLVAPELARRFSGEVVVHDAEDPGLVPLGEVGHVPLRVNRALAETDVVVVVSAAETVLHGGPATLLGAGGAEALRAADAYSLLESGASSGWRIALGLERALAARVPAIGVSLSLEHPELAGSVQGYPYDPASLDRVASSPLRTLFGALPGGLRAQVLHTLRAELGAAGAFGGPPSVAHAEALLRAIEARATPLRGRLDAIVIGIPGVTPYLPRERPNPLLAAYLGLGFALRLWREAFPVVEGGTAILVHSFRRQFAHPTQAPYRTFFAAARAAREPEALREAERAAAADERAVDAYRGGRSVHPLLPFADWAACQPALGRLGAVLVADCRDATAARQLGFVPVHGLAAAIEMAQGRAGEGSRVGVLVAPPWFPLVVSDPDTP